MFKILVKLGPHLHYSYSGPGPPAPNLDKNANSLEKRNVERRKTFTTKIVKPKFKDLVPFC